MSNKMNYELSVWKEEYDNDNSKFNEKKLFVIGATNLDTQSQAFNITIKRNVNGSKQLTFKMYYNYIDNITGLKVNNPYIPFLQNETKLKLKWEKDWYDFVIKNITKNNEDYSYSFSCEDELIQQLSKNGYGVTLAEELKNNQGTAKELTETILEGTDWNVESEIFTQRLEEPLVKITVQEGFSALKISDENPNLTLEEKGFIFGDIIYCFFSSCQSQPDRFQFIYENDNNYKTNSDRIIKDNNNQYYVDNPTYQFVNGYYLPSFLVNNNVTADIKILQEYRGNRYVFSKQDRFNTVLNKYLDCYTSTDEAGNQYYYLCDYTKTPLITAPLRNLVTNANSFKGTDGWQLVNYDTNDLGNGFLKDNIFSEIKVNKFNNEIIDKNGIALSTDPKTLSDYLQGKITTDYNSALIFDFSTNKITNDTTNNTINDNTTKKPEKYPILVNSGFYDNRSIINNIQNGEKYHLYYKVRTTKGFAVKVIVGYETVVKENNKDKIKITKILEFDNFSLEQGGVYTSNPHLTAIAQNCDEINTNETYSTKKLNIYIIPVQWDHGITDVKQEKHLNIFDFQIYKDVGTGITPYTEASSIGVNYLEEYTLYLSDQKYNNLYNDTVSDENIITDITKLKAVFRGDKTELEKKYQPAPKRTDKIGTVSIEKSNYYNNIQSVCEQFECWADFKIIRKENGAIDTKTISLKNYVGKNNYAAIRYGLNLKSISRTDDSTSLASKLIVQDNNNEFGKNGICSISRAQSNETGENFIYNFTYFLNKKLIDENNLYSILYDYTKGTGADITEGATEWNCYGYYVRLKNINTNLDYHSNVLRDLIVPYSQTEADLKQEKAKLSNAQRLLKGTINSWEVFTIYNFDDIGSIILDKTNKDYDPDLIKKYNSETSQNYLNQILNYQTIIYESAPRVDNLQKKYNYYVSKLDETKKQINLLNSYKKELNSLFTKIFSKYILEGTWVDESYNNDEKYYIDAQSTLYNSAFPQVTYNFSMIDISSIPEYKDVKFDIGNKTWVEDVDMFGYVKDNIPYREEVVISEITTNLCSPDNTTITVQNFKDEFTSLFQRTSATIQSVQYNTGSYQKAAELVKADTAKKLNYLSDALNNINAVFKNMGEQSVVQDKNGITITDLNSSNNMLRLVSGGILLSKDGGATWSAGISADGISASILTTGILKTNQIQIMNDNEAYFRWDPLGITAYDFELLTQAEIESGTLPKATTTKGIRFDRFGIYGFSGIEGTSWKPTQVVSYKKDTTDGSYTIDKTNQNSIRAFSDFELTREGLYFNLGKGEFDKYKNKKGKIYSFDSDSGPKVLNVQALFGRTDGLIYNTWNDGNPYFDLNNTNENIDFSKIMSVSDNEGEQLAIYSNGKFVSNDAIIKGIITANGGKIGGYTIAENIMYGTGKVDYTERINTNITDSILNQNINQYENRFSFKIKYTPYKDNLPIINKIVIGESILEKDNIKCVISKDTEEKKYIATWTTDTEKSGNIDIEVVYLREIYTGLSDGNTNDVLMFGGSYDLNQLNDGAFNLKTDGTGRIGSLDLTDNYIALKQLKDSGNNEYWATGFGSEDNSNNSYFYGGATIDSEGKLNTGSAKFKVDTEGKLYATDAEINGFTFSNGYLLTLNNELNNKEVEIKFYNEKDLIISGSTIRTNNTVSTRIPLDATKITITIPENYSILYNNKKLSDGINLKGPIILNLIEDTESTKTKTYNINYENQIINNFSNPSGEISIRNLNTNSIDLNTNNFSTTIKNESLGENSSTEKIKVEISRTADIKKFQVKIIEFTKENQHKLTSENVQGTIDNKYCLIEDNYFINHLDKVEEIKVEEFGNSWNDISSLVELEKVISESKNMIKITPAESSTWIPTIGNTLKFSNKDGKSSYFKIESTFSTVAYYKSKMFNPWPIKKWNDFWVAKTFTFSKGSSVGSNFIYEDANEVGYLGLDGKASTTEADSYKKDYTFVTSQTKNSNFTTISNSFCPSQNGEFDLGNENRKWKNVYANSMIQTSDRNEKNSIENLPDIYSRFFDKLQPVIYKYNSNHSDRYHTGFIAQDVKMALEKTGLSSTDFAAYCEWLKKDDTTGCGLRYEEFIALNTNEIQRLKKRITELENKLKEKELI